MALKKKDPKTIDEYIGYFPDDVREILVKIRETIKTAAPDSEELIRYQIPTFYQNGNLVHFAGYKNHIGFYPTPSGIEAFSEELSGYEYKKGSVKFKLNEPIPYELIKEITLFRVDQNNSKVSVRTRKY